MRRHALLLLTLALIIAACGDDDDTATTATTVVTTTTTAATTTAPTTTSATTTTAAPTTTTTAPLVFVIDTEDFFPDPLPGSADAHGSGCVSGPTLGDGIWFGFAHAVADGTITFDLACFFTGPAAVAAATADGAEAFDFYIRNANPSTRAVPMAADAQVYGVTDTAGGIEMVAVVGWPPTPGGYLECPAEFCAVWLYVNGGIATGIVEQYLP